MIYSPWGSYVPMGSLGIGPGAWGASAPPSGGSQYTSSPYAGGDGGPSGPGPSDWSSFYSPEAVSSYSSTASGFLNQLFGRGVTPPTTATSAGPPLLLIGGIALALFLTYRYMKKS